MPKVSEFFGIVIYLYFDEHPPPHFHARYAGEDVVFHIETLDVLHGHPSPRMRRLVVEWGLERKESLRRAWEQARSGVDIDPIPPLE